jgi:hypothetical protein
MFYSVDYCRPCVEKAGVEARREERARLASAKQLARYRKAAKAAAARLTLPEGARATTS